ncbi:MAG: S16 family serine protease [Polyangiaceae bacterium]
MGHRPEEAAAALREAVRRAPEDAEILELYGDALFEAGRDEEARASYEAASMRAPDPFLRAKVEQAKDRRATELATDGTAGSGGVGRIGALAWNPTGGIVSPLQAEAVAGRGELHVTGNVRGTGVEAGRVVHTFFKQRAGVFGIEQVVATRDLHLHYADADFAKEGPSAGAALALAALSAYTQRPLPAGLAATGQMSLEGALMPISGLPEKLLAAYLGDVRTVVAPRKCLYTIRDLPRQFASKLRVVFVDSLREAASAIWEKT